MNIPHYSRGPHTVSHVHNGQGCQRACRVFVSGAKVRYRERGRSVGRSVGFCVSGHGVHISHYL